MRLSFRIKHHFFSAFRELFVYNHSSLEFRAKIFALLIATNESSSVEAYIVVKKAGNKIYKNNEERADLLMISTKELVNKVKENNGLYVDTLISNIQKELRAIPRYAKKIDIELLKPIIALSHDEDTIIYQKNILNFLRDIKEEILHEKKSQIAQEEKELASKE